MGYKDINFILDSESFYWDDYGMWHEEPYPDGVKLVYYGKFDPLPSIVCSAWDVCGALNTVLSNGLFKYGVRRKTGHRLYEAASPSNTHQTVLFSALTPIKEKLKAVSQYIPHDEIMIMEPNMGILYTEQEKYDIKNALFVAKTEAEYSLYRQRNNQS